MSNENMKYEEKRNRSLRDKMTLLLIIALTMNSTRKSRTMLIYCLSRTKGSFFARGLKRKSSVRIVNIKPKAILWAKSVFMNSFENIKGVIKIKESVHTMALSNNDWYFGFRDCSLEYYYLRSSQIPSCQSGFHTEECRCNLVDAELPNTLFVRQSETRFSVYRHCLLVTESMPLAPVPLSVRTVFTPGVLIQQKTLLQQ